jgi:Ca2+-binding RTX toxin-like protein
MTTQLPKPESSSDRPPVLRPILATIAVIKAFAALRGDGGAIAATAQAMPLEDDSGGVRALPNGLLEARFGEGDTTGLAGGARSRMHFAVEQDNSDEGVEYFTETDVPTDDSFIVSASGSRGGSTLPAGGPAFGALSYSLDAGGISAGLAGSGTSGGAADTSAIEGEASDGVDDIPDDEGQNDALPDLVDDGVDDIPDDEEQNDAPPDLVDDSGRGDDADGDADNAVHDNGIGDIELVGGGGDDRLAGIDGDDSLYGGDGDDSLHGGAGDDRLSGGSGDDTLEGGDNDDFLIGGAGDDSLDGGADDDVLVGGPGNDILKGGDGADRFVFDEASGSASTTADLVFDFNAFDGDKIDVSAIDANSWTLEDDAFAFIGDNAFSGTAGELRFADNTYYGVLEGDLNGDGAADFGLGLLGVSALMTDDFIL